METNEKQTEGEGPSDKKSYAGIPEAEFVVIVLSFSYYFSSSTYL